MKKRLIIIVVMALALLSACGYMVVEHRGQIPETLGRIGQFWASAEVNANAPAPAKATARPVLSPTPRPAATPTTVPTAAPTAAAPTAVPTAAPTAAPAPGVTPAANANVLQNGSKGDEVKAVQKRLRELGFTSLYADGVFGPRTQAAVQAFQKYLYDLEHPEIPAVAPTEAPNPDDTILTDVVDGEEAAGPTENPMLVLPDAAPEATEAPAATTGSEATIGPDATAEPGTTAKPVFDGIVDEALKEQLLDGFVVYRGNLARGAYGDEVMRLQQRLNTLEYLYSAIDGIYGGKTEAAVTAFQKRNKLPQTGVADEATQLLLFSDLALKSDKPALPYELKLSVSKQRVYAYGWNPATGSYSTLVRTMVCSSGLKGTPTPTGAFKTGGPVARWGYFPKWNVWAQYLTRIRGPILFHSVLYNSTKESSLIQGSLRHLGSRASHGCVRLSVADAKWIYNNCPAGTSVTIY